MSRWLWAAESIFLPALRVQQGRSEAVGLCFLAERYARSAMSLRPLQRELAGDEDQCRGEHETQDGVRHAYGKIAADDDARQ
jgi:hypothetical protein